LISSLVIDE